MVQFSREAISASKVVALIGVLVLIREAIVYFQLVALFSGYVLKIQIGLVAIPPDLFVLWGIIALIISVFIFFSLNLINLQKISIPYLWWVLLILGIALFLISFFFTGEYLGCTLVLIAFLLELLSQKKTYIASKIVVFIGSGIAIYESIMIFYLVAINELPGVWIANAIFGIIFAIMLLLIIWDRIDIKIPYAWWVVLIAGFVIFTWVPYIAVGGAVILVGFILLLLAK